MLIIVSPAKKLDFDSKPLITKFSIPEYLDISKKIICEVKKLNTKELQKLMGISKNLADLNLERFNSFKTPFTLENAKQAIYVFKGDTYVGLNIESLSEEEIDLANDALRILSGLYGVLKPLDLIQPYRLEMGTRLAVTTNKNLYELWININTNRINHDLKGHEALINLASKEYFSSIDFSKLSKPVITPIFKENKNGVLKIVSFNAKRARGMMAQFIIKNKITKTEDLKKFNMDKYKFQNSLSSDNEFVFTR